MEYMTQIKDVLKDIIYLPQIEIGKDLFEMHGNTGICVSDHSKKIEISNVPASIDQKERAFLLSQEGKVFFFSSGLIKKMSKRAAGTSNPRSLIGAVTNYALIIKNIDSINVVKDLGHKNIYPHPQDLINTITYFEGMGLEVKSFDRTSTVDGMIIGIGKKGYAGTRYLVWQHAKLKAMGYNKVMSISSIPEEIWETKMKQKQGGLKWSLS